MELTRRSRFLMLCVALASVLSVFTIFAGASSGADAMDLSGGITAVKAALSEFSVSNLVSVIVAGLSVAVPLVLMWFGFRFIYRKAKGALKRGT